MGMNEQLIEFAKEQCEIFPEYSNMGKYLRETLKMLQTEPCEDAISKASVFEILGNLMSIPYDCDRQITEKDVSESMDVIRTLPPVTPKCRCPGNPNKSEIPTGSNNLSSELEKNSKKLEKDFGELDCISRQAVLKLFNKSDCYTWETALIKKKIEQLPPVTPARKKGKWVTKYYGFPPEPSTVCSNCGYDIDFEVSKLVKADAFTIEPYRPNYCPNCGAEMESKG